MISGGVAIVGSTGRLGSAIQRCCHEHGVRVVATASSAGWTHHGGAPRVVIDAGVRQAAAATVDYCSEHEAALLYCVSNPSPDDLRRLRELSARVPVCLATNLSPLHRIQAHAAQLSARLAARLALDCEITVIERHPTTKRDAPSATARRLAQLLDRPDATLSERYGGPVSDHRVVFTVGSESYELCHSVRDLGLPALGALRLAERLADATPGWHTSEELYDGLLGHDPLD